MTPDEPRVAGWRDHVIFSLFVLLWLLPVYVNAVKRTETYPYQPASLSHLTNVSCLFTHSVRTWTDHYVLGLPEGNVEWVLLPHAVYSPMQPLGHRHRIDFLLDRHDYASRQDTAGEDSRQRARELARWYAKRYLEENEDAAPLRAIRQVTVSYPVGEGVPGSDGHWQRKPWDEVPWDQRLTVFTYDLSTDELTDTRRGR